MNIVRDQHAGMRWLNTLWAEDQRQRSASAPQPTPQEKKKREAVISRYAHNAT